MAKLIVKPAECAYRSLVADKYFCNYPGFRLRYCTWVDKFPSGCPLPDCKPVNEKQEKEEPEHMEDYPCFDKEHAEKLSKQNKGNEKKTN